MNHVSEILGDKGNEVLKIDAAASALDAVRQMVGANIGSLLVTDGDEVTGIVTERDFLRRVAQEGPTDEDVTVRDIMSSPLVVVSPETEIDECMADDGPADSPSARSRRRRRCRHCLDRRRREVQVEAAELRDPLPDGLHHVELSAETRTTPKRGRSLVPAFLRSS
jgi:hypothetical protein